MTAPAQDIDRIAAIEDGLEIEHAVQGSRFLGQAFRAESAEDAARRLKEVQRRYHDATHHCWAFRVGRPERAIERWDDDGEPSGTAGVPIMGAIRRDDVTDALVVVTRYFGGTKLGTGGLTRAYAECARLAVATAPGRVVWRRRDLRVACAFDQLGPVESVVARAADGVLEIERSFEPEPVFHLGVKESRVTGLSAAIREATAGRARVELL